MRICPPCSGSSCHNPATSSNFRPEIYKDRPYHHAKNGGYRNPPGSPRREASFGDTLRFVFSELTSSPNRTVPEGHVLLPDEFRRQLNEVGNPSVTWLGHSASILRLGERVILTDPFLGKTAGPYGFGPKRYAPALLTGAALPKADVLLVSHNHYDRLDAPTIEAYPYKEDTQVIVPLGLGPFFTKRGYARVLEQDWWDVWHSDDLTITTLPAVHGPGRGIHDQGKTLWASFGITTNDGRVWFSGDTANGDVLYEVGRRTGPYDLALMAIGAYEPRNIMKPVHVDPEEAVEVLCKVGARAAIGMHWGAIALTPENPFDAPTRFRNAARDQGFDEGRAITLRIGESRDLQRGTLSPKLIVPAAMQHQTF